MVAGGYPPLDLAHVVGSGQPQHAARFLSRSPLVDSGARKREIAAVTVAALDLNSGTVTALTDR